MSVIIHKFKRVVSTVHPSGYTDTTSQHIQCDDMMMKPMMVTSGETEGSQYSDLYKLNKRLIFSEHNVGTIRTSEEQKDLSKG